MDMIRNNRHCYTEMYVVNKFHNASVVLEVFALVLLLATTNKNLKIGGL